ncbi:MAG: ABC transporter permease [bacterium]|nr:ABC transporter permease [bacterium]
MIRSTNLKVAFAHLTSRVKQALVAVLSVTFGISMYIFMNSFMTGVNDTQTELAFSTLAHIKIYNDLPEDRSNILQNVYETKLINVRNAKVIQYTEGIRNSQPIIEQIEKVPEVTGVTSQVNMSVYFRNGSTKFNGQLSGVNAKKENEMFGTATSMKFGVWEDIDRRKDGLILGSGLANKLGVDMDDNVTVSTADGITKSYRVIGIIETSMANIDNSKAYININTARQLESKNQGYATDIQVNLIDYDDANELAERIGQNVDYKVESWIEANGQLEAGNELRNYIAIAVSLTILLVAGFGIYNIMNMTVNEKIKEIAILKAMGFEGGDIIQIFLVQSIIIGILGGLVGMIFGFGVASIINQVPFEIASIDTLPMAFRTVDYVSAFVFGMITTIAAGFLPARTASLVDPVSIIRG